MKANLIIILAFLGQLCRGQDASCFINISSEHGLPSSECYHVMQDSKGYMWISTDRGVVRYDGREMKIFTKKNGLGDNTVFGTYEDRKGRIWFRTFNGQLGYYYNGSIHRLSSELGTVINKRIVTRLYVDPEDNLWCGMLVGNEILKIPPAGNYAYPQVIRDTGAVHIHAFSPSEYVYSCKNNLITRKLHVHVTGYKPGTFILDNPAITDLGYVLRLRENAFVFASSKNSLIISKKGKTYSQRFDNRILDLFAEGDSAFWVSVYKCGVFKFRLSDPDTPVYHLFEGNTVTSVCRDYEGGYWFSCRENGVYYRRNLENVRLDYPGSDAPTTFRFVKEVNKRLFFGTDKPALFSIDSTLALQNMPLPQWGPAHADINSIAYLAGKYYLTAYGGITVFDKDLQFQKEITSIADSLHVARKNTSFRELWFVSPDSFYYDDGYNITFAKNFRAHKKLTVPYRLTCFIADKNQTILMGSKGGLFISRNLGTPEAVHFPGLDTDRIVAIKPLYDDVYLIGAQQNGIFLKSGENYRKIFSTPYALINDLCADEYGNIWLATSDGIVMLDKKNWSPVWIGKPDGLQSNEIRTILYFNRHIWYTTNKGIYYFPPGKLLVAPLPPRIEVEQVQVNDRALDFGSKLILAYDENNITVKAKSLSYLPGDVAGLKYRLLGYDSLWRVADGDLINYTNLPSGSYTLEVKSFNSRKDESTLTRAIRFEIKKPFWLKWWFISFELLIGLAVIGGIVFLYIKNIRRKAEEKTRINKLLADYQMTALRAQIKPHFIFNCISSIQTLILKEQIENAYEYLQKFSKLLRLVLENSKRNFTSLEEELEVINLYVELEQLRFDGFTYTEHVDKTIDTSKVTVPYMILQPIIENAIWHGLLHSSSKEKKLNLTIKNSERGIIVQVFDNGVGREKSRQYQRNVSKTSMGQSIVMERLSLLNSKTRQAASIEITDLYDSAKNPNGTLVTLIIPHNQI